MPRLVLPSLFVGAALVAAAATSAPAPAGAAFTTAEWSCGPSNVSPYTATIAVTITNVARKDKFDGTIAAVVATINTSVTSGAFPGTFGFYATNPLNSTTASPVVSKSAIRGNNSISLNPPNDVYTSGYVGFDPSPNSAFCAASAVIP